MSRIEIRNCGIMNAGTDAVVNAANEQLSEGGGVCGIIFSQAGSQELTAACNKIGYCPTGNAVITPAFKLKAKFIIHAVGPIWKAGSDKVIKQLYGAYYQSLELAYDNSCASIAFPLISAGIFGAPVEKSWRKGLQACRDFFDKHHDFDCTVVFAVPSEENRAIGFSVAKELGIVIDSSSSEQSLNVKTGSGFVFFWHEYEENGCFSQWYKADMMVEGVHYVNCEQYMMAKKALAMDDLKYYAIIMNETDPRTIKKYGKLVRNFKPEVWNAVNGEILYNGNYAKFSQNAELKKALPNTGDSILAEASPLDPNYGISMKATDPNAKNPAKWKGTNLLGKTLMRVRKQLREE